MESPAWMAIIYNITAATGTSPAVPYPRSDYQINHNVLRFNGDEGERRWMADNRGAGRDRVTVLNTDPGREAWNDWPWKRAREVRKSLSLELNGFLTRLRTGHDGRSNGYQRAIHKRENPECHCGRQLQSAFHLAVSCPELASGRTPLNWSVEFMEAQVRSDPLKTLTILLDRYNDALLHPLAILMREDPFTTSQRAELFELASP